MSAGLTFWVVWCWVSGVDQFTDPPNEILGPFPTKEDAQRATWPLTCANRVYRMSLRPDPSEWMTSDD